MIDYAIDDRIAEKILKDLNINFKESTDRPQNQPNQPVFRFN